MSVPTGLSVGYPQFRPLHAWNGGSGSTWQMRSAAPAMPSLGVEGVRTHTVRFANFHTGSVVWLGPDGDTLVLNPTAASQFTSCPAAGTVLAPGDTVDCIVRTRLAPAQVSGPLGVGYAWRYTSDPPSTSRPGTLSGSILRDEDPIRLAIGSNISAPSGTISGISYPSYAASTVPVEMSGGEPVGRTQVQEADLLAAGFAPVGGQLVGWIAVCSQHAPTTSPSNVKSSAFSRSAWGKDYYQAVDPNGVGYDEGDAPSLGPIPPAPNARWVAGTGPSVSYASGQQRWNWGFFLHPVQRYNTTNPNPAVSLGGGWWQWAAFPVILDGTTGIAVGRDVAVDEAYGGIPASEITQPWYHLSYPRRRHLLRIGPADLGAFGIYRDGFLHLT